MNDWDLEFIRRQREYAVAARQRVVQFLEAQMSPATANEIASALQLELELVELLLVGAGELMELGMVQEEGGGYVLNSAVRLLRQAGGESERVAGSSAGGSSGKEMPRERP